MLDTAKTGRYFRLLALSEVNGNPWASAAEFTLTGCVDWPAGTGKENFHDDIKAFPVPTNGMVEVSIPEGENFQYRVISATGRVVGQGPIGNRSETFRFDLGPFNPGMYLVQLTNGNGVAYCIKVLKK